MVSTFSKLKGDIALASPDLESKVELPVVLNGECIDQGYDVLAPSSQGQSGTASTDEHLPRRQGTQRSALVPFRQRRQHGWTCRRSPSETKEKAYSIPVQVFVQPLWGGTKVSWVQTDHGLEDLMRLVAVWRDGVNIDLLDG